MTAEMRVIVRYDFPEWWDSEDVRQYIIHSDWDRHDHDMTYREIYLR